MTCECFSKEKTFNLSPDFQRREGNNVFKEISHVRDRGAKGPTKPETRRKPQRPRNKIGGHAFIWRIALQPCFFLTEKLSGHSSLDSVGRAGLRPPAVPAQGWGVSLYSLQGYVWVPCCLQWRMDAIRLSRRTSQPWDTTIPFMWAIEKNETPLHKVGNLLSKVLRLLKKKANPLNTVMS